MKNEVEWTGKVRIINTEISGKRGSMRGYILI